MASSARELSHGPFLFFTQENSLDLDLIAQRQSTASLASVSGSSAILVGEFCISFREKNLVEVIETWVSILIDWHDKSVVCTFVGASHRLLARFLADDTGFVR